MPGQAFYRLIATGIILIVATRMDRVASGKGVMNLGDPRAAGAQIRLRLPRFAPLEAQADVRRCSAAQNTPLPGGNATARSMRAVRSKHRT